jgi:C-terminal binding protein
MNRRQKSVVTDFIADALEPEKRILVDLADVVAFNCYNEHDLVGRLEDADAIMLYHNMSLTRKTIERLGNCKLIVHCVVGYDNVDHALARQRGIAVANVPDYGNEEVADSAIGMILALTRGIHQLSSLLRAGIGPWRYSQVAPLYRLRGRVFGVVGLFDDQI